MALFKLFGSKPKEETLGETIVTQGENSSGDNTSSQEVRPHEEQKKIIKISWGTGMPIDVIFGFVHRDFEECGYQDALINTDIQYRETKEAIIRNDLKMLFRRIALRYRNDIREIDVQIDTAKKACALSSASLLQARRETYEEHLSEIFEMEKMLDENNPQMTTMIESYRRGFLKGIAAKTIEFINNE